MVLGPIAFVLGSGFLWNHIKPDSTKNVPIIGDALSAAANFAKVVGKDGKDTSSSSSSGDQLMSQVSSLREELRRALRERDDDVTIIDNRSGAGAYTVTAVVVAGLVSYAYIRWKGWKISDIMWVTKRGLNDACSVVGNQLNEVSDTVHVTKKHLAGRIDRVDATLDETQEIIEGTRDEVSIIHVNLSSFQKELQEVNRTVEIWGSRLCSIEDTQDRTVRATEALVGFGQQMEHDQSGSFRQLPPPPPLALETMETISSVAESEPTVEETQENRKTLSQSEGSTRAPNTLEFLICNYVYSSDGGSSDLDDGDEEQEDEVENEDVAVDVAASDEEEEAEHPQTSSATVENRPDPAIRGHEQKLDSEKIDGKNQSDDKAPSRSARRKKMKRQIRAEVIKEMREAPSRDDHRKNMKRQIWAEAKKEFREMKKDKLLENIKKLQACVWLLEKDSADMAKIMEFRSLLESTKKQYVENEAQLAKEGSSAPLKVLNRDRLEKTHVKTIAAPVEMVDRDDQSMDSGKVEVISLKGCEEVSDENELAEEVNRLKSELETVRQDRDHQLAQAQSLMADIAKQKEVARRYELELEDAMMRVAALEKGCLLRRETIKALQIQLASANEKLTVPSPAREKLKHRTRLLHELR
ncbi:hypothetical protein ACQ4PT_002418 [Festuca glaucescens]